MDKLETELRERTKDWTAAMVEEAIFTIDMIDTWTAEQVKTWDILSRILQEKQRAAT